jgi:beta-lactamase regulating signal transducer with metallopeptidase domain
MLSMLISGALRASAVLAIGLLAYALLRRAAASTRRVVLVATLAAALVVPLIAAVAPSWHVAAPRALRVLAHESAREETVGASATAPPIAVEVPSSPASWSAMLVAIWLAGALALGARIVASHRRVRRIARSGIPFGPGLACAGIESPALYGKTVLLPLAARAWPAAQLELVALHEQAHAKRHDPLAQLVADVACAVHWVNPLAWLAARRLRIERELAADDAVLAAGVRASTYAEVLLAVAGAPTAAALAMAERTTLGTRIVRILAPARRPLSRWAIVALAASSIAVGGFAACASLDPAAESAGAPREIDAAAQAAANDIAKSLTATGTPVVVVLDANTGAILAEVGPTRVPIVTGSTLKPFTIAAALDAGAITATQTFDSSTHRYGSDEIRDAEPHEQLDVAHILAVSSNAGTSRIFDALGADRLVTYLSKLGLPAPHVDSNSFAGAQLATGEVMAVTPLALAEAYVALANARGISATTSRDVMAMLATAVTEGTGKAAAVPNVAIAGKTGTAELDVNGALHTYASFVGVAQLPSRRVIALVGVDTLQRDRSGGSVAAPAFAQLIGKLLH